jgi:hypothetical protein
MDIRHIEQDDRLTGSYVSTIKVALICLLLGGGFLASAKFLPWSSASEPRLLVARLAEVLGWGFLASSTAALLVKWLDSRDRPSSRWASKEKIDHLYDIDNDEVAGDDASTLRSRAIDELYAELRPLMSRAAVDPGLKEDVKARLSVLRRLQTEEADEMAKRFDAGLLLKPGEGWQALERAGELLARYEDPASPDAPTLQKD